MNFVTPEPTRYEKANLNLIYNFKLIKIIGKVLRYVDS